MSRYAEFVSEDSGGVTVQFWPTRYVPPQLVKRDVSIRQQRVLAHLAANPHGAAVRQIASVLGMGETPCTVREDLATLKTLGPVEGRGWG